HSYRLTSIVVYKPAPTSDPMDTAIRPDDAILRGIVRPFLAGALDYAVQFLQIFGANAFFKTRVRAIKFAWSKSEHLVVMPQPDYLPGDQIPVPQADVRGINRGLQAGFACTQCFLGPLPVVDIRRHAIPLDNVPHLITQRDKASQDPAIDPISSPHP